MEILDRASIDAGVDILLSEWGWIDRLVQRRLLPVAYLMTPIAGLYDEIAEEGVPGIFVNQMRREREFGGKLQTYAPADTGSNWREM